MTMSYPYPAQFWEEVVIYQITSGSISFVASTLIVSFIAHNGLNSTPYRRIIFGLSLSDMIQSFALVAGPFLTPSDTAQALWGIGNKRTCYIDGLLYLLGMATAPMYTVFLCVYYVYKLKNRMTDDQFTQRIEKKVHVFIVVFNLALYLPALGLKVINPSDFGNYCCAASFPTGCSLDSEQFGECDQSLYPAVQIYVFINYLLIPVLSLIGIFVCIGLIFWHTLMRERIFGMMRQTPTTNQNTGAGGTVSAENSINCPDHKTSDAHADAGVASTYTAETLSRIYKRELVTQVCCYVMVFCLISLPFIIFFILLASNNDHLISEGHIRVIFILHPLAGFLNIIVYTRWNVRSWKRKHPDFSWVHAFWLVLKAGGDLPEDDYGAGDNDLSPNQDESRSRLSIIIPPETSTIKHANIGGGNRDL